MRLFGGLRHRPLNYSPHPGYLDPCFAQSCGQRPQSLYDHSSDVVGSWRRDCGQVITTPLDPSPDMYDVPGDRLHAVGGRSPDIIEDRSLTPSSPNCSRPRRSERCARRRLRLFAGQCDFRRRHRHVLGAKPRSRVPRRHDGELRPAFRSRLGARRTGVGWGLEYVSSTKPESTKLADLRSRQGENWYVQYQLRAVPGVARGGFASAASAKQYQGRSTRTSAGVREFRSRVVPARSGGQPGGWGPGDRVHGRRIMVTAGRGHFKTVADIEEVAPGAPARRHSFASATWVRAARPRIR